MVTRPDQENWQDHWCPAYFPLVGAMEVEKGDTVRLKVTHSELHVMFEVLGVDRHASGESEWHADASLVRVAWQYKMWFSDITLIVAYFCAFRRVPRSRKLGVMAPCKCSRALDGGRRDRYDLSPQS